MPKYCTWDGKRDRWVFQLRVPGNLREHFRGVAVIREHDDAFGLTALAAAGGMLTVPRVHRPVGTPVRVRVRARDVMLAVEQPHGLSALNVLAATIREIGAPHGPVVEVRLAAGDAELTARLTRRSVSRLDLRPGRSVYAVIKSIAFDEANLSLAPHYRESADAAADTLQ